MNNPLLVKSFKAGAAIPSYTLVTHDGAGGLVPASDSGAVIVGCALDVDTDAGDMADIALFGLSEVRFGGTLTVGDPVTTDANGKAVKAAPGAGVQAFALGFAMDNAVSGDIAPITLSPFILTGV